MASRRATAPDPVETGMPGRGTASSGRSSASPVSRQTARDRLAVLFLLLPLLEERRFAFFDVRSVACRIDERIGAAALHPLVLGEHAEVGAVGAEEQINGKILQHLEGSHVVLRDL